MLEKIEFKFVTEDGIRLFEKIQAQMYGLYEEMVVYSKKTPDSAINQFKLKIINEMR